MTTPLRLTLTDAASPDEVERCVRAELAALEQRHPQITGCHVTLQGHPGTTVRVALSLPTGEVAVEHESGSDAASNDPMVTVRESFVAARRALLLHARELRARDKSTAL